MERADSDSAAPCVERLLYFSPADKGGLADYARHQANALVASGVTVDFLTTPNFIPQPDDRFKLWPVFRPTEATKFAPLARARYALRVVARYRELARIIDRGHHRHVLLGAYAEYLSPFWTSRLQRQARRGVAFGAVIHDPVRDFQLGPGWWHRWSVASAYSFLREAFVHHPIDLDTGRPTPRLRTTVIPHGAYEFPPAGSSRQTVRAELQIPDAAETWLSFGHIRDGKNIDLLLRALVHFPQSFLVVAGEEQSGGQRSVSYYREIARKAGVADRCRWLNRFIPASEVGGLFAACDLVMLAYSNAFRSASGVLNAAVSFRKPCIASGGPGSLATMVQTYRLGIWVPADDVDAIAQGVHRWRNAPLRPDWDGYSRDNSWARNAALVRAAMFDDALRSPSS